MDRGAGAQREGDTQGGRTAAADDPGLDRLLVRAADGDEEAFAELYDALAHTVLGLATRVIRDKAQAEEVTQDVMVEVWRTADRFRPARGAARNWVLTLAHRRAVDRVRSVAAGRARELRAAVREQERSFDTVAEEVETREEQRVVFRCLTELTRELRLPLVLAYYEGLTYAEVAEALSMPAGTVKSRMRQGLRRLHDCMEAGS
ncbi:MULTISPECIES: ECF RNA polymerase sigma factor SigK [Streptomyces]|uniref:ECF RNA polymerase sigma factor SigK n=1 Tax=Streptomyces koelreuteriae TaxID=2838015 RepID=A0ABX8FWZ8_9ACTN|nr:MULTISPECIES: ECF RNA polymerase sigma factor SigK [Streptomyces]QWB25569.1 ECF RNA polymerase sigma factor SigK [Streptomyces koelreuteriae]UUA08616.1 ECF RNA polymerase sigma factor SigK [Streptomyces koelreuteriae]UUA16221.1 ECF RNA polymerase sigma factor SigK [Streptomyces sp. CRCS-T-1]